MKKPDKEAVVIASHISHFLRDYAPKHLTGSQHTIRSYENALTLYVGYLEESGISIEHFGAECFARQKIEDWLTWLSEKRGCSPDTCNNRLASIRAFLKYIASRDVKYADLSADAASIKLRKTARRKVTGLTREAIKTLMEIPDVSSLMGIRDLAFMVLLYATAMRLDEILSLRIQNIHLEGKAYVNIIGKRNKLRTLYLLPKAVGHIRQYVSLFHGEHPSPDSFLFYSGLKGKNCKLSQPAIAKMLKKYANQGHTVNPEVPLDLHAHQFRHAKASHWLEDGMNIVQISFLLGHAQLQTTMMYLDITPEQEAMAMATLEDEEDKKAVPKWKNDSNCLAALCGLKRLVKA